MHTLTFISEIIIINFNNCFFTQIHMHVYCCFSASLSFRCSIYGFVASSSCSFCKGVCSRTQIQIFEVNKKAMFMLMFISDSIHFDESLNRVFNVILLYLFIDVVYCFYSSLIFNVHFSAFDFANKIVEIHFFCSIIIFPDERASSLSCTDPVIY